MELPTHILLTYGYLLLFVWVLIEQFGVPLPAIPVLLAAGALSTENQINIFLALVAGIAASLIADTAWFFIGRRYGHHVLRFLCKLSMEPTICVRRTQNSFGNRRNFTLVIAKFIPGLSTLAPPVAGQNGMQLGPFLLYDGIGSLLWIGSLLALGRFCGDLLKRYPNLLDWVGRFSGALLALGILGFFLLRLIRRQRTIKRLIAARLEPHELKQQLDNGDPVFIVDLRHPLEVSADPFTLPGAQLILPDQLADRHEIIPRDRDVILFCSCPSEATAAKTAMALQKLGIDRVRPLRGGYDEWKRLGFPMDAIQPDLLPTTTIQIAQETA